MLQHVPRISIYTYRLPSNTSSNNHKEQFYITWVQNLTLPGQHRKVQTIHHYKPWAHGSHIIQKLKDYYIYMLSRSSITIKPTTMMMSCSRTPSQPQWPTLPHQDRRGRSGRTPPRVHLQLSLEATWVQRYSARLTRINKQGSCKGSSKSFTVK